MAFTMLGIGSAHADGTDEINGWTVTPTGGGILSPVVLTPATLSDPSNSLGLGISPIAGLWTSNSPSPFSSIGTNDQFATLDQLGTSNNLFINDNWLLGVEEASVQVGIGNEVRAFLVPTLAGNQLVDLFNVTRGEAPPLFKPDATGPIYVGGVELASPQDGALLNDLSNAIFTGDTADWSSAMTLVDDYLGIDPSSAADAVTWVAG